MRLINLTALVDNLQNLHVRKFCSQVQDANMYVYIYIYIRVLQNSELNNFLPLNSLVELATLHKKFNWTEL